MSVNNLVDKTLAALEFALRGRDDFFLTTSFGYQSSLLFFLFTELGACPPCLFVKSALSAGGIDQQIDYVTRKFDIKLSVVDRNEWLESELRETDFMSLEGSRRKKICRDLKRGPLLDFIDKKSAKIWVSGIRQDQTEARQSINFLEVTDLNVIKISPLYAWSKDQVKYLISSNNLRINDEYFDLCKINESAECGLHF